MKKILASLLCSLAFLLGCNTNCQATTVHVGGAPGRAIVLVNSDVSDGDVTTTDSNGDVTVPCGQHVGIGQTK